MKVKVVAVAVLLAASTATAAAQLSDSTASPLARYAGFGHNLERDEARFENEELEREEITAACMEARGFTYHAAPSVVLTDHDLDAAVPADPNEEYVSTLSAEQRRDYYVALTGSPDPFDEGTASTDGGCMNDAFDAIPGVYAAKQELREEWEEMEQAIAQDPRVEVATQGWSTCMARYGFTFESMSDMYGAMDSAYTAFESSGARRTVDRGLSVYRQALGVSDRCSAGFYRVLTEVRVEHEAAFVDAHRDTLERYRRAS